MNCHTYLGFLGNSANVIHYVISSYVSKTLPHVINDPCVIIDR